MTGETLVLREVIVRGNVSKLVELMTTQKNVNLLAQAAVT